MPVRVPETFIKDLAILAGIFCLCIIILSIVVYTSGFGELYIFITGTMFGSPTLTFAFLAIGMVIVICLLWHAFWRQV